MADFPCEQCRSISAGFARYHPTSWAWDNVLQILRRHWLESHKDISSLRQMQFLQDITSKESNYRGEKEAGRSGGPSRPSE